MSEQEKSEQSIFDLPPDLEDVKNEGDQIAGRVHDGFDILAGGDTADNQAKRFARHDFQRADFAPTLEDNYAGARGSEIQTFEQLKDFAEHREALFRAEHPDYDHLVNTYLLPRLHEVDPEWLGKFLTQDNFPQIARDIAKQLQRESMAKAPTMAEVEKMSGDEFAARLNEWTNSAQSPEDEDDESLLTKETMKRLNNLSADDFRAALDALKARGW
jgi:hypothetical protein